MYRKGSSVSRLQISAMHGFPDIKHFRCVLPESKRRTVKHKGRLAVARQLYGDTPSEPTGNASEINRYGDINAVNFSDVASLHEDVMVANAVVGVSFIPYPANFTQLPIEGVSNESPSRALFTSELSSSLATHLVDIFARELKLFHVPTVDFNSLFKIFLASGRKIEYMPNGPQILMLVLLSLAARMSNHSAILGPNAPEMEEIFTPSGREHRQDHSLLHFGYQR